MSDAKQLRRDLMDAQAKLAEAVTKAEATIAALRAELAARPTIAEFERLKEQAARGSVRAAPPDVSEVEMLKAKIKMLEREALAK